jgi:hypothetical protein
MSDVWRSKLAKTQARVPGDIGASLQRQQLGELCTITLAQLVALDCGSNSVLGSTPGCDSFLKAEGSRFKVAQAHFQQGCKRKVRKDVALDSRVECPATSYVFLILSSRTSQASHAGGRRYFQS